MKTKEGISRKPLSAQALDNVISEVKSVHYSEWKLNSIINGTTQREVQFTSVA
jgi:hypothetical protein